MPYLRIAAALLVLAPLAAGAQQPPPVPTAAPSVVAPDSLCLARAGGDTAAVRRCAEARPDTSSAFLLRPYLASGRLRLDRPAPLSALGSMRVERAPAVRVANAAADSLRREALRRAEEAFRAGASRRLGYAPLPSAMPAPVARADSTRVDSAAVANLSPDDPLLVELRREQQRAGRQEGDGQSAAARTLDLFGDVADLGLVLNSRLETKVERSRNERCTNVELLNPAFNCAGTYQPQFDFQFNVRTGGIVADRIHMNVDYDSQREFDASNNINVYYEGKSDELIERLEVGNVFFSPPSSRFITGGIPSGNYGMQAKGQLGPMRFSTIVAQQKGNRVNGRTFDVGGDGTLQTVTTDLEDFRFEQRRFFWVVDPELLAGYPRIDILNAQQLRTARDALSAERRPAQVRVYRWRVNAPNLNDRAPRFELIGAPAGVSSGSGNPYELLTPGVDYYIDPSLLWFVLVRPVAENERVVLAYVPASGTPDPDVTGTPDLEADPNKRQTALLVYASEARPTDPVFRKEIRSVYRIGGEDLRRETVTLRIGTQAGGMQEVPSSGAAQTFLQMLGLAQAGNSAVFDVDNRLWPRPGDPVQAANGSGRLLFADRYLVFPSLRPFGPTTAGGLVQPGDVANDTIYAIDPRDLNSQRRPPARYFMRATFQAQGGGDVGSLMLGSVQLSRNSERLTIDGVTLRRGEDYEIDYELGRVSFSRPDTLFRVRRQVMVQYEENPLFAAAPTNVFGLASQLPFQNGQLNFVAISQNQRTAFNRPPLGFEPASSLVAGVNGTFLFDAAPLSRFLERIPTVGAVGASSITVAGEIATSRPQPNAAGVAYVESFEGEGGVTLPLAEGAWYYGSVPLALEQGALAKAGRDATDIAFDTTRASTLTWQNTGAPLLSSAGGQINFAAFSITDIDPQVRLAGRAPLAPEQVLWLNLHPNNVGGVLSISTNGGQFGPSDFKWRFEGQTARRRWRSLRTVLSPTGADLSRTEYLEFWALVDPQAERGKNPVLVFDFGEISENSLAFVPESVTVARVGAAEDRTYFGRRTSGFDRLDTERDLITNQFDVTRNDVGLPSDVADTIVVIEGGQRRVERNYELCRVNLGLAFLIGDSQANCSVGNNRLDEEDINLDRSLNLTEAQRQAGGEQFFRFVVDLNDRSLWTRPGGTRVTTRESADGTRDTLQMQWQLIRLPINAADDTVGDPALRRIRALRLTMVSGPDADTSEFSQVVLARLRLIGSPWLKRQDQLLSTLVGENTGAPGTFQIAGIIGTQDSTEAIPYQPPPGVVDAPENRQTGLEAGTVQINERSIRIRAGGAIGAPSDGDAMPVNHRAEAYFRFPEGQKNFMGYRELRVWARGYGDGWGFGTDPGELEFFVKIGRDAENFYLFRRQAQAGTTVAAWTDVAVRFEQLYRLRAQVQNDFLQNRRVAARDTRCDATDEALLGVADTLSSLRQRGFWACAQADGGTYMMFTTSPNNSAPNLAQVQELAVGFTRVRVDPSSQIAVNDTLEVWADDIRLTGVVDDAGYAGELTLAMQAGDVGRFALSMSRRDANFRQLGDNPSYITDGSVAFSSSFQLDRFIPGASGWSLPVSFSTGRAGQDPYFLAQQDLRGAGIEGLRTPRSVSSRYAMSLRRSSPTNAPFIGALVDNLAVDASMSTGDGRDSYTERGSRAFDVNTTYAVQARARTVAMPGFLAAIVDRLPLFLRRTEGARSLRQARFRWNPSTVRFSSNIGRSDTRTTNFLRPARIGIDSATGMPLDTGRVVEALSNLWRNSAGIELRPFGALTATWTVNSLRDLRHYDRDPALGDTINVGVIAAAERERLLGVDLGLERERQMSSGISFQPVLTPWLRPRVELTSSFSYLRDPNSRQFAVLDLGAENSALRLPRRLNNSQNFNTGLALDIGRALLGSNTSANRLQGWQRALSDAFGPIDISYSRSFSSAFDGTPFTPGLDYQFGLGGFDNFLEQRGRRASNASLNNSVQVRSGISLPLGLSLQQEIRRSYDRAYYRVSDDRQLFRENETLVLPRVNLNWNYRPRVALLSRVISNISANAGYEPSETRGYAPSITEDSTQAERSLTETRTLPVRASVTWAFLGELTTSGTWRQFESEEVRPGARVLGDGSDFGVQVSRIINLPKRWKMSDQVMTAFSWQQTATRRYVPNTTGGVAANQASNGRTAFNLNADTQLAENLLGSLVFSRVINYDNVTNRRFSQLVMTAVFQLTFQAGELR